MPRHVVVDGSNIATEGRPMPSLRQLNEAVLAFLEEHPDDVITVVVDATFGHRIDPTEVAEFDDAVDNNELVAPPAGAIGRGDAFVLTIAAKAGAVILSNDSFQEFHPDYPWLFDDGRLIGGKPVPNVGWVFVPRAPVRGPVSRRAQREAKHRPAARAGELRKVPSRPSKAASEPMPVPSTPPPARRRGRRTGSAAVNGNGNEQPAPLVAATEPAVTGAERLEGARPLPARNEPINELMPFLDFVSQHPVGSEITAQVEQFSSHGAYVDAVGVRCYVPLRYMGTPAPRSARSVLQVGETRSFVVVSFNAARRGVDVALPEGVPTDVSVRVEVVEDGEAVAVGAPAVEITAEPARPVEKKPTRGRRRVVPPEAAAETLADVIAGDGPMIEVPPADITLPLPEPEVGEPARATRKRAPAKKKAAAVPAPAPAAAKKRAAKKQAAPAAPAPAKKQAAKRATKKQAAPAPEPVVPTPVKQAAKKEKKAATKRVASTSPVAPATPTKAARKRAAAKKQAGP